jgi:predicted ATPase
MLSDDRIISENSFQTFGDLLKYLRRRARLTQRELSIAVNYSEAQISRLERNQRHPDMAALAALFIPALYLEDEPQLVSQLMELAARARGEELPGHEAVTLTQPVEKLILEERQIVEEYLRGNLPLQLTSFIGRQVEIAEIKAFLGENREKNRLITLTGSGGCGKTRLAIETAGQIGLNYADGIWFIDLASISNPSHVTQKIISSLGLPEPRRESPDVTLIEYLKGKQLLLIVDNCEHVLTKSAQLIQEFLSQCPNIQVLATSREILNIPGELRYNVPPLTISEDMESDSVRLFVDRAKSVNPLFEVTGHDLSHLVQICQQLEGIPLAIELAAARVVVLTVQQIAYRLEESFQLLSGGSPTQERHQTMEIAIAWSYDLLSEAERALLRRLSVFSGGWTVDSAEQVASDPNLVIKERVLDLISQLVNKSLVMVNWDSQSEARYVMLQTVLDFARIKLLSVGETETYRERHFQYFCTIAKQGEVQLYKCNRFVDWAEAEILNIRAALSWALDKRNEAAHSISHTGQALELMSHIHLLWFSRDHFSEGKEWLDQLLAAHTAQSPERARGLVVASIFAWYTGDLQEQAKLAQQSLDLSRKLASNKHIAWSLCWLGVAERNLHNYEDAIRYLTHSLVILQKLNDPIWESFSTFYLADSYVLNGNLKAAKPLWKQGVELCRREGYNWQIAWGQEGLGFIEQLEGNHKQAKGLFSESLNIKISNNDTAGIAYSIGNFALQAASQEYYQRAVKLWGAAENLRQKIDHCETTISDDTCLISSARSRLGEERFSSLWSEGCSLRMKEAISLALSNDDEQIEI